MEDVLKRLLDTEHQAESLVDAAHAERNRILDAAQAEARAAEARLEARLPELRAGFMGKAAERAEQAISEITRRANERQRDLRHLAESHEQEALAAALALLIDPAKD
jgi:V/A-type H+/Na+-transporting ATPase subunit G/H